MPLILLGGLILSSPVYADAPSPGQVVGRNIFGLATDVNADPLLDNNRAFIYEINPVSEMLDMDNSRFLISVFDARVGTIYLTSLDDAGQAIDTAALDLSSVGGVSAPGVLKKTRWDTLLLSESARVDGRNAERFEVEFSSYFKNNRELVNPYHYGWLAEVILLNARGEAKLIKNFAPGRLSATDLLVMPDNRTFYFLDSAGYVYLFVADEAGSLANGELYAVDRQGQRIRNVLLGKGSALRLKLKLKRISFNELFDSAEVDAGQCPAGFSLARSAFGSECLKLKKKNRAYAGIFEPQRYAATRGVRPLAGKADALHFDSNLNQLQFVHKGVTQQVFALGSGDKINSQFLLR